MSRDLSWRSTLALTQLQMKLMLRDPGVIFWSVFFPVVMVFVFGEAFGNNPRPELAGSGYIDMILPGLLAITIMSVSFYYVGVYLVDLRSRNVLRRLQVTPLPGGAILLSQVIPAYLLIFVTGCLILLVAVLLYQASVSVSLLVLWLSATYSTISFLALGFVFASLLRSTQAATALAGGINMVMIAFSGAVVPLALMPDRVQTLSHILPLTYVVNVLRGTLQQQPPADLLPSLLVLTMMMVGGFALSAYLFRWN